MAPPRLEDKLALTNRQVASHLLLQQLLYYNIWFSIFWFPSRIISVYYKYGFGIEVGERDIVRMIMMILWMIAEPLRLSAGWFGNIQENVPILLIFITLSMLPQCAVAFYLYMLQWRMKPWDKAMQVPQMMFLGGGIVLGIVTVRRMVRIQQRQFSVDDFMHQIKLPVGKRRRDAAAARGRIDRGMSRDGLLGGTAGTYSAVDLDRSR